MRPTRIAISLPASRPITRQEIATALREVAAELLSFPRQSRVMSGPVRTVRGSWILSDPAPDPKPVEPHHCGARDGASEGHCIMTPGHVEAGDPIHSNGRRTWRARKPRTKK